jgi:hypothetical protein
VCVGFCIGQIIDGYNLNFVGPAAFIDGAQDIPSDTAVSIDCNFDGHKLFSSGK